MKEDSSQLWEAALVRLRTGEDKLKLAGIIFKKGNYAEAILNTHHAVYHTARAILYAKQIQPETDSQAIEEFGLNFLQSGIIDKEDVRPYLTFKGMSHEGNTKGKVFASDKEKALHVLNDARHFIKYVEKYIKKEIKTRRRSAISHQL